MALAALVAATMLRAQTPTLDPESAGRAYLIAFPDTVVTSTDPKFPNTFYDEISLYIYSPAENHLTITGIGSSYKREITLAAAAFTRVDMNDPATAPQALFVDTINTPIKRAFLVEATSPVVLYCWMMTKEGSEAWTPVPLERWGRQYYAAAIPGEVAADLTGEVSRTDVSERLRKAPAEIVIIASEDGTRVTLTPPVGVRFEGGIAGHSVTLDRGDAYMVRSIVDASGDAEGQPDIAMTRIESDKPVGVLSGNTRAQVVIDEVGLKNNVYKNLMIEWLPPAEQYGTEFLFLPTWDQHRAGLGAALERKREFARIYNGACAQLSGIYLQQGGITRIPFKMKRDTLAELALGAPTATYFKTQQPVGAMMHSAAALRLTRNVPCDRGIPCLTYNGVAPYMVEMTPSEQWTTFAPYFGVSYPDSMAHYVSVAADTADAGRIYREDGTPFPFTRRVMGTRFIWGTDTVTAGSHYLEGRGGARFYGVAFGIREGWEDYQPDTVWVRFQERVALSYGYPLAPERKMIRQPCQLLDTPEETLPAEAVRCTLSAVEPASAPGTVRVTCSLGAPCRAELAIYASSGERVAVLAEGRMEAGDHVVAWDLSGVPAGIYFCTIVADGWSRSVPVAVVR